MTKDLLGRRRLRLRRAALVGTAVLLIAGCGGEPDSPGTNGAGQRSEVETGTEDSASGGTASEDSASEDSASGGTASGGTASGGTASGGTASESTGSAGSGGQSGESGSDSAGEESSGWDDDADEYDWTLSSGDNSVGTAGEIQGFDALLACDGAETVINDNWQGFESPRNVLVYLAGAAACRGDVAGARRWHDVMQSEYGTGGMGNWGNVCAVHRAVSSVLFQEPPDSFGCPEGVAPPWEKGDSAPGTFLWDDPRTPDCDESVVPPVGTGGDCDEGGADEGGAGEGGTGEGGTGEGGAGEGGTGEGGTDEGDTGGTGDAGDVTDDGTGQDLPPDTESSP